MSNDRSLEIENGTMGNLFRRAALAALGLDALEDVSDQSFKVIDRADAFAARILGNMSGVMPKADQGSLGLHTTELADHIFEGMVGLNGPSSATDLGEWQYWLDATLLMLFDEDDDEAALPVQNRQGASKPRQKSAQQSHQLVAGSKVTPEIVRERIAALKRSGVRPEMIQAMPQAQKRAFAAQLKRQSSASADTLSADIIAKTMRETLDSSHSVSSDVSAISRVFAQNSRQILASRISEKALALTDVAASDTKHSELLARLNASIVSFNRTSGQDMAGVRNMLDSLDSLESAGALTQQQTSELRKSCQSYVRRALSKEMTHDVSLLAERFDSVAGQMASVKMPQLGSQRAFSLVDSVRYAQSVDELKRSFAALSVKLDDFNSAVAQRVLTDGESAATMRWQRASDRFGRMHGISDDVDRVLLRDVVESAAALEKAGIVSRSVVDSVVKSAAAQQLLAQPGEMSRAFDSEKLNVSFIADNRMETVAPQRMMALSDRVVRSVRSVVDEIHSLGSLVARGGAGSAMMKNVESFVSAVRNLVSSQGNDANVVARTSSMIDEICGKLDEFAQDVASSVVTMGYDDLTSESGVYVSTSEKASQAESLKLEQTRLTQISRAMQAASASSDMRKIADAVEQARTVLSDVQAQNMREARRVMNEQAQAKAQAMGELQQKVLDTLSSAEKIQTLVEAQKTLNAYLNPSERANLERMISSAAKAESHIASVERQIRMFENASELSAQLKQTLRGKTEASVVVGDVRIDPKYFATLGETLNAYAKVRDGYQTSKTMDLEKFGMNDSRIAQMLSTVVPVQSRVSGEAMRSHSAERLTTAVNGETILGYDDVVPSSMAWVRQQTAQYPSSQAIGDLSAIFGSDKAIAHHMMSIAGGNLGSVEALGQAISKRAAQAQTFESSKFDPRESIASYALDSVGDRVKVAVNLANQIKNSQAYALRRDSGNAYLPQAVRASQNAAPVEASLNVTKLDRMTSLSAANEFVPVMAGAQVAESKSLSEMSTSSREALIGIAGRLGISGAHADQASERLQLRAGGVEFNMTSDDFVEMLAKPTMVQAAYAAPSLTNADHILFSGYASMLGLQGERRTLRSLRHAYMSSLANAGSKSAHGDFGFNTQTFSGIMGMTIAPEQMARYSSAMSDERSWVAGDIQATQNRAALQAVADKEREAFMESFARFTDVGYTSANTMDFSWVSHALTSSRHVSDGSVVQKQDVHERQILTKIDNMLDYVENMSRRDVGVFSSDDTVRVLLEALPEAGKLGNKGLPKWRQKETRTSRAAEARELREALMRIGANPIQGTQAYANKRYVSPNLMDNQSAAPLFSGGSDGGSSIPSASAMASKSNSQSLQSSQIPEEDLQVLAEEVFQKIIESFNEELQRRRSE